MYIFYDARMLTDDYTNVAILCESRGVSTAMVIIRLSASNRYLLSLQLIMVGNHLNV